MSWNTASGATSYRVYDSTTSGGPYTWIGAPTTTSFSLGGLSPGTTRYFVVRSLSSTGLSASSAEVTGTSASTTAAPTGLVATAASSTQINLTWNAVSGANSYRLFRSAAHGGPYDPVSWTSTNSYSNGGLSPTATYYYVVVAYSSTGGTSPNSAEASATTPATTAAPTNLQATPVSSTQVNLTWDTVTGANSYRVFRGTNLGGPYTGVVWTTNPTYADVGLTSGTDYYYVVVAYSSTSGFSPNSTEAHARTP